MTFSPGKFDIDDNNKLLAIVQCTMFMYSILLFLSPLFSSDGSSICTTGTDGFIKLFSVKERSESIAVKREEAYW